MKINQNNLSLKVTFLYLSGKSEYIPRTLYFEICIYVIPKLGTLMP